jgi:hypothetical protein
MPALAARSGDCRRELSAADHRTGEDAQPWPELTSSGGTHAAPSKEKL